MTKTVKWVWLSLKCRPGGTEILTLVERFKTVDAIYDADFDQYIDAGIGERFAEELCDKSTTQAAKTVGYCQMNQIGILCYDDFAYPSALRSLKNPPAVLYYMGRLPDLNKRLCISIVGTRKMSEYGMHAAYKIAYETASSGAVVVSGMALGIDGIASCAAIAAKGLTVAVLGCGIDIAYPKEHSKLKEIIKQNGAVISEYPPATEPRGMNFPVRNRIISGISQGVVVVDADVSSGAMITAKHAILQGRDVYAVPGNIDAENSSGTNSLIRDGAQAVLCGNDIIRNYAFIYRDRIDMLRLRKSEERSAFNPEYVKNMGINMRFYGGRADNRGNAKPSDGSKERTYEGVKELPKSTFGKAKVEEDKTVSSKATIVPSAPKTNVADREKTFENKASGGDNSSKILEGLNEKQRRVFEEMPLDHAVTVDYLTKTGFSLGEVISALTVLEIKGLVSSLPGALYVRK
jgi:DNA processing protein